MTNVAIFDMAGNKKGEMELKAEVFGCEINKPVLHSVVRAYLLNQRQGTQSTKTRSEVSGGGAKPWKQKGTGRARQGSIRAPQWRHGGVALGPKPREYGFDVNKKVKRLALKSAFSTKVASGNFIVMDAITCEEFKTKNIIAMLKALNVESKTLIVALNKNDKLIKSASNIPGVKTALVNTINVYDILAHDKFIIVEDAVRKLEEVYA